MQYISNRLFHCVPYCIGAPSLTSSHILCYSSFQSVNYLTQHCHTTAL